MLVCPVYPVSPVCPVYQYWTVFIHSFISRFAITWTTNCLSVAFTCAVAIFQPPIEGTRENFPSDCGDPYPIHSPSCKKIFVTYFPDICHRLRRQDHLMLIWLTWDRQSSYPGSKDVRLCEALIQCNYGILFYKVFRYFVDDVVVNFPDNLGAHRISF